MAGAGGFKFGTTGGGIGGGSGGFSFGNPNTTKPTGLAFGTPAATTSTPVGIATGFKFGSTPTTSTSSGGLTLGLGGAGSTGTKGFNFGGTSTTTTTSASGLTLGGGLGGTSSGLFGGTNKPTGLTLGTTNTGLGQGTTSSGIGLGLGGTSTAGTTASTGLTLGGSSGTGLLGGLGSASSGLKLGGLTTTTSAGGLCLGATPTTKIGLGGVDPSSLVTSSANSTANKTSDSKSKEQVVKEADVPQPICQNVTSFKEYVKKQKGTREEIMRFSDKPMQRIREETMALNQLVRQAASSLQRNATAVRKLKEQSAQQLKDAEIAQRTREIPAALQLEYSAPAEYFQRLVYQFEQDMVLCRQQIEQMESFMAALDQPVSYSPQELSNIMVKLNETFVALAAQLQGVHEIVKAQKEQYLNYRRVYQGDSEDVFSARRKLAERQTRSQTKTKGPQPFTQFPGMALVMATALQSAQKPAGMGGGLQPGLGTNTGLGGASGGLGGAPSILGNTGTSFGGFGTGAGNFGAGSTLGGGLGGGGGLGLQPTFGTGSTGLFGNKPATTASSSFNFGGSLSAGPTLGTPNTGFGGFGTNPASNFGAGGFGSTTTGKPLQLQKPPSKHRKSTR